MREDINLILKEYYSEIENISELKPNISFPSLENLPEDVFFLFRIEYFTLNLAEKDILKIFRQKEKETINYIKKRLSSTSNVILKAKYNHFTFILTKNNSFCQEAIIYYQEALKKAVIDTKKEYYELIVDEIFETVLELSIKIKYNIPELKLQIEGYLKDENIADKLKTRLFQTVKKTNIFLAKEVEEFPLIFIALAESCEDINWAEHNLNIALFYAQKNKNQQQIQAINELLGDNECKKILPEDDNNLAIPHLNESRYEKIIEYYKRAKCDDKLKHIWELHKNNKKNKKYIPIRVKSNLPNEFFDELNSYLENISNMPTINIVGNLITCQNFPLMPNSRNDKSQKIPKKSYYEEFFMPIQNDTNSNHKKIDSQDNNKFSTYNNIMKHSIDFISRSILLCIEKKKLSYKKLYTILLKHTPFGLIEWQVQIGEERFSYTWLSMIDIGLESFFEQYKKMQQNKMPDWRVCVDVLTPKFEGIFREILESNGANLTELKDGNTSTILLEKMLRLDNIDIKEAFYKSFDDDDLDLFQYAFSSKAQCLNIRNNVAHSFYVPQQYTLGMAVIVLLGILRLAKFIPTIPQKKDR